MGGDLYYYIQFGFLKPGKNVFSFESNGSEHFATLLSDGILMDEDQRKHTDIYTWYLKYAEPPFNYKVKYKGIMFDVYQKYMKHIRETMNNLKREVNYRLKELGKKELLNSDRTAFSEYIKSESNLEINEVHSSSSVSDKVSVESDTITFSNTSSSENQSPKEVEIKQEQPQKSTKRKHNVVSTRSKKNNNNSVESDDNDSSKQKPHVTLLDGIVTGVFKPGKDVFLVRYNNIKYTSSLTNDGFICYDNCKFPNPSKWVIYIYKRVNPSRKSVSGWKVVIYNNQTINVYVPIIEKRLIDMGIPSSAVATKGNNNSNTAKRRRVNRNRSCNDYNSSDEGESENESENEMILAEEEEEEGEVDNDNQQQQQNNNNNRQKNTKKHNNKNNNNNTSSTFINSKNINVKEEEIIVKEDPEPIELQTIQLKPFVEKGILTPGVDILEYIYNGINCRASLMNNGKIRDANLVKYRTPTDWGNAVLEYYDIKSRLNHWNRIRYDSKPILYFYNELLK